VILRTFQLKLFRYGQARVKTGIFFLIFSVENVVCRGKKLLKAGLIRDLFNKESQAKGILTWPL
jgi:hypothetical protein